MRLLFLVSVLSIIAISGCAKRTATPSTESSRPSPELQQQLAHHPEDGTTTPTAQIKFFTGSVGSALGLQMRLVRDGGTLTGNYYYQKIGTKTDLKGNVDNEGNVTLEEYDAAGTPTGVFKGIWKLNEDGMANIVGNWSKPNSDKKTAFSLHEEPIEFSGTTELVTKSIKETKKKPKYEIDVSYPQIEGAAGSTFDKFNQAARSLVMRKIVDFRKDMNEMAANPESVETSETGSDLGIGYSIGIARDDLISVEFDIGGYYQGAAHPNSYTEVINFDVKNGKVLKLADLFKPGSKYLSALSAYAIKDLKAQAKAKGPDSMLDDQTIQTGAGPAVKNFKSWTVTKKGIALTFDAYQVAPYAAGPQQVIVPYSVVKDIINPDGPLAAVVK